MRFNRWRGYDLLPTSYPKANPTSSGRAILLLSGLYILIVLWYYFASARDPTSLFFDKRRAYSREYSITRVREAHEYIKHIESGAATPKSGVNSPILCVGVATVARRGEQYVNTTIGSIVEGLSTEERGQIFLNVLVAHTDSHQHPDFSRRWLHEIPDRLLEYDPHNPLYEQVKSWEKEGLYRNKTIFDYTYLLQDCYNTGASYVLMVEDDTLAARHWYSSTMEALHTVEKLMRARPQSTQWAYLRLFFMEELLGWNSEEWPRYLLASFTVWFCIALIYGLFTHATTRRGGTIPRSITAFIFLLLIPASVLLHFAAGRQTMWPMHPGVHELNKFGCCSQALVFPRPVIPLIIAQSDLVTDWLVDMMIETIADRKELVRWATVPALFQHIGSTSSKGYGFDENARTIWNFGFENL